MLLVAFLVLLGIDHPSIGHFQSVHAFVSPYRHKPASTWGIFSSTHREDDIAVITEIHDNSDESWSLRSMTFPCLEYQTSKSADPNLLSEFLLEIGACSVSITDHDRDTNLEEAIFREPSAKLNVEHNDRKDLEETWPHSMPHPFQHINGNFWKRCDVTGHFPTSIDPSDVAVLVQAVFELNTIPFYSVDSIPDRDWVIHVQSSWKPIVIGQIVLRFPWHTDNDVRQALESDTLSKAFDEIDFNTSTSSTPVILLLEGGIAFGTGEHPTTRLCLSWIEEIVTCSGTKIANFLDYGAGSGVLGMAACALGQKVKKPIQAIGVEIDADSIIIANKNCDHNKVDMHTYLPQIHGIEDGEALSLVLKALQRKEGLETLPQHLSGPRFDACAMNILAGPLIMLKDTVANMIRPGGHLGMSGILSSQAELVATAYRESFDNVIIEEEDSGWVLVTGTRKFT